LENDFYKVGYLCRAEGGDTNRDTDTNTLKHRYRYKYTKVQIQIQIWSREKRRDG